MVMQTRPRYRRREPRHPIVVSRADQPRSRRKELACSAVALAALVIIYALFLSIGFVVQQGINLASIAILSTTYNLLLAAPVAVGTILIVGALIWVAIRLLIELR